MKPSVSWCDLAGGISSFDARTLEPKPRRRAFVFFAGAALGLVGCGDPGADLSEPIETTRSPIVRAKLSAGSVSTGQGHTCAVTEGGGVKCWGKNYAGQLGYGDTSARGDGPGEMGDNLPFVNLGTGLRAQAVVAQGDSTCALIGTAVKCWGANSAGQLGLGDTNDRGDQPGEMGDALPFVNVGADVRAISSEYAHTCVLTVNDQVKCWGWNVTGQLGLEDTNHRGDNPSEMGPALPVVSLPSDRIAWTVSAGRNHSCAILNNFAGSHFIKCWGEGARGKLGYGDTGNRGDNPSEMGTGLPFVSLGTGRFAKIVSAGSSHTCAMLDNGKYKCWGSNQSGQLGLGDRADRGDGPNEMGDNLPYVSLGSTFTGLRLAVNTGSSACAISLTGKLKCWGTGSFGGLGSGSESALGDSPSELGDNLPYVNLGDKVEYVDGGLYNYCALLTSQQVKCWGWNANGELGLGDTAHRGDNPGEMGAALPAVDLGTIDI